MSFDVSGADRSRLLSIVTDRNTPARGLLGYEPLISAAAFFALFEIEKQIRLGLRG